MPALDAAQRQELVAQASGKSTREVKQLLAGVAPELVPPADRLRALGDGRWELKVVIDSASQCGIEQLRALLSHVDPHLTLGQLVERLVQDGLQRYDPGRPPRGRRGGHPGVSGAGQAPEPKAQQGPAGGGDFAGEAGRARATPSAAAGRHERRWQHPGADRAVRRGPRARDWRRAAPSRRWPRGPRRPRGARLAAASTPVSARPAAAPPGTATSAPKPVADRGSRGTAPTPRPRPTPAADQGMADRAGSGADRGRNAPSPAKPAGSGADRWPFSPAAGARRPRLEAARSRPTRARRSRYIPAPVRREVWRRDGGCCSYVDPHSGRRCGSRFLLELDHIVPFALGGSAEPGNLRVLYCSAHNRFRHREVRTAAKTGPRDRRSSRCELGGWASIRWQREQRLQPACRAAWDSPAEDLP